MKWSNQKPPGLDTIFDRHKRPHAIGGDPVVLVDGTAHHTLASAISNSNAETALVVVSVAIISHWLNTIVLPLITT